jgi:hypothetical protein
MRRRSLLLPAAKQVEQVTEDLVPDVVRFPEDSPQCDAGVQHEYGDNRREENGKLFGRGARLRSRAGQHIEHELAPCLLTQGVFGPV